MLYHNPAEEHIKALRAAAEEQPAFVTASSFGRVVMLGDEGVETHAQAYLFGPLYHDPDTHVGHIYLFGPKAMAGTIHGLICQADSMKGEWRSEARREIRRALRETNLGL